MNDKVTSKPMLWADRIRAFQESGLSRKDWCQQNSIPQSTFTYWFRKLQSEFSETEDSGNLIFAMLPSEQELCSGGMTATVPVTICLPKNIRIEIGAECPSGLISALLQALKGYD